MAVRQLIGMTEPRGLYGAILHKLCSYISTIQSIGINCMSKFLSDRAWWIADLHYFSRLHFADAWAVNHADIPM